MGAAPNKNINKDNKDNKDIKIIEKNENNGNSYIFWIDKQVYNEENQSYLTQFPKGKFILDMHDDIKSGLKTIKDKKFYFKDIYLILSGSFYQDFILQFKKDLKEMLVIPKIIIFTSDKELFLERNSNIKDIIENKFYNLGGIQTSFKCVYEDFFINKSWKKSFNIKNKSLNADIKGEQYTFEKINNILELYLPVYYISLFELNEKDNFDELTHYLYDTYKENKDIKELLGPIDGIPDIPLEILCKYYAKLYTIESKFYNDLNEGLRKTNIFSANKNNNYSNSFIKSFYEAIKLGGFDLYTNEILYRFSCLGKKEFDNINEYLNNKKPGIPGVIFYSRTFLSFSEKEKTADIFYKKYRNNKNEYENENLIPVYFHLIKKEKIKEALYSHIRIDNISEFQNEKEVLFLPFTCFEILKVTPKKKQAKDSSKTIYIIELTYLGKYEKELRNNKKEEKLPDTKFRQSLEESNITEINPNTTTKSLVENFNEYEKTFIKNHEDIYIIYDVKEEDIDKDHNVSVFGKNYGKNGIDFIKENREKIKILINNEEKALEYKYKLKKGINKIIIKLKSDEIVSLEYMFSGCTSLKSIEGLKYLDTKNIKNFSFMFSECKSLSNIQALENWNVSNGNNFKNMFWRCKSLSDIKALENWDISNGTNFSNMFCDCKSLSDIKPLEKWNVSNGIDFEGMFRECKSLSDIKPLENWNVSNGINFEDMFSGCDSLSNRTPIQNWNTHGYNPNLMFGN